MKANNCVMTLRCLSSNTESYIGI